MEVAFLEGMSLPMVVAGCIAAFVVAVELGYRFGAAVRSRKAQQTPSDLGTTTGGLLALLGLLLAFTFGMAGTRYEERKATVIEEANAIGTSWLRTALVPEPMRTRAREVLRAYTDVRLQGGAARDRAGVEDAVLRSEQLHGPLWETAAAAAAASPTPVVALFVASVNEVIDMHGRRIARGIRNPIPPAIYWTLLAVSAVVLVLLGYGRGIGGDRNAVATTTLSVVLALVIGLTIDLDRPRAGYLKVSQQAMRDVRALMGDAR